jgi:hypothetical protein
MRRPQTNNDDGCGYTTAKMTRVRSDGKAKSAAGGGVRGRRRKRRRKRRRRRRHKLRHRGSGGSSWGGGNEEEDEDEDKDEDKDKDKDHKDDVAAGLGTWEYVRACWFNHCPQNSKIDNMLLRKVRPPL